MKKSHNSLQILAGHRVNHLPEVGTPCDENVTKYSDSFGHSLCTQKRAQNLREINRYKPLNILNM